MVKSWQDVDGLEAEARLRGIRRRLSELDAALTDQQSLLRDYPDSFSIQMSTRSLSAMNEQLLQELVGVLRYRKNERLEIVLDGDNFSNHSAKFSDLGVLFSRFQRLYTSVAQAVTSGPTLRGPISSAVRMATDLRLNATFASSFGMEVYVPSDYDLLGESIASDALEQLFQLLSVSSSEQSLMPVSGAIGRRALGHLRSLAVLLNSTDSKMSIGWKDFAGSKYSWKMDREGSSKLIAAIDNIAQTRSETKKIEGLLVGASLLRNRFEIVLDNGGVIEGKFVVGLGAEIQAAFGKKIVATVDETEISDRASGDVRTYHALKGIEQANQLAVV